MISSEDTSTLEIRVDDADDFDFLQRQLAQSGPAIRVLDASFMSMTESFTLDLATLATRVPSLEVLVLSGANTTGVGVFPALRSLTLWDLDGSRVERVTAPALESLAANLGPAEPIAALLDTCFAEGKFPNLRTLTIEDQRPHLTEDALAWCAQREAPLPLTSLTLPNEIADTCTDLMLGARKALQHLRTLRCGARGGPPDALIPHGSSRENPLEQWVHSPLRRFTALEAAAYLSQPANAPAAPPAVIEGTSGRHGAVVLERRFVDIAADDPLRAWHSACAAEATDPVQAQASELFGVPSLEGQTLHWQEHIRPVLTELNMPESWLAQPSVLLVRRGEWYNLAYLAYSNGCWRALTIARPS